MIWILAGAALATVIALGAAAFWLVRRSGGTRLNTPEEAMQAADQAIAGFVALSAAVGADGQSALVFGEGVRVAVVKVRRAGAAAREIVWGDVRATRDGLLVATGDWRLGTVLVADVDNLDVRRLAPQLTRG
ncbi:hypothetical protein LQ954_01590 [Sphingomonas sp. IC-11]|uniref:hypothetical protein n=1 Tax=Sphingomonas sp. IC-11 TaxID=2898528 RepID=UPI001E55E84A|nr:hypothetical protein [Sphingomonas sp. IC-11]MCD2314837.1 hypothetical protein [Sphingomonas sp. IC-11]